MYACIDLINVSQTVCESLLGNSFDITMRTLMESFTSHSIGMNSIAWLSSYEIWNFIVTTCKLMAQNKRSFTTYSNTMA